jgi:hypothetical protein
MSVPAKSRMCKRKVAMLTPAMLRRLLLALAAFSLMRAFAVEGFANGWIYG